MISATVDELTHLNRITPRARAVASAEAMDWPGITKGLNEYGNAVLSGALTVQECNGLADLYANEEGFRSWVVMASHGFAVANTNTSIIHCQTLSAACVQVFTASSYLSRMRGTNP